MSIASIDGDGSSEQRAPHYDEDIIEHDAELAPCLR
jgi:hypothetical protein